MSQAPCYKDSAKCLCACEIKANRYIGSSSRSVKLCQWRKGNHQRLFSIHSTAGWRDLQGLIVHQLEAAEILCLCFDCSLYCGLPAFPPKWHAFTPQGTLKYNGEALGHTHTQDKHTHTQIIDRPQSQPVTPTSSTPPGTISCRICGNKKINKKNSRKLDLKKKSGWETEIKTEGKKWHELIVLEWIKGKGRKTLHLELRIKVIPTGNLS